MGHSGGPFSEQPSAAELADAVLAIIDEGGRHAWHRVVDLCERVLAAEPADAETDERAPTGSAE